MLLTGFAAIALMAPAPALVAEETAVGYEPLIEGKVAAAINEIEANETLDANDPARLINLGIAYANQGRTAEARTLFETAMNSSDRLALETADGDWKDSKHLARLALKMLERGDFASERMASR